MTCLLFQKGIFNWQSNELENALLASLCLDVFGHQVPVVLVLFNCLQQQQRFFVRPFIHRFRRRVDFRKVGAEDVFRKLASDEANGAQVDLHFEFLRVVAAARAVGAAALAQILRAGEKESWV
jgi:hypothetical protein